MMTVEIKIPNRMVGLGKNICLVQLCMCLCWRYVQFLFSGVIFSLPPFLPLTFTLSLPSFPLFLLQLLAEEEK